MRHSGCPHEVTCALRVHLQRRELRHHGAKANTRMGLHVHVGAADFTPTELKNLVRTFYKQEGTKRVWYAEQNSAELNGWCAK